MTLMHLGVIAMGVALAALGILTGHYNDVRELAGMLVGAGIGMAMPGRPPAAATATNTVSIPRVTILLLAFGAALAVSCAHGDNWPPKGDNWPGDPSAPPPPGVPLPRHTDGGIQ